jgi:hypothetical protein
MAFKKQKLIDAKEKFISGAPDERVVGKGGRPKFRKETKRLTVYLDEELHEDLVLYAGMKGKSVSLLINEMCKNLVAGQSKLINQVKKI